MSFVDSERQWFKARVGLKLAQTPRDVSICAHAILETGSLFIVEDASSDPRFASNALVTGPPNIRFYAGMPILSREGLALGTVCVIDTEPRHLDLSQLQGLEALARHTTLLLSIRAQEIAASREVNVSRQRANHGAELLDLVLQGAELGVWDLHVPTVTWTINAREREMLGYSAEEATGDQLDWKELIHPEDWPRVIAAMELHLTGGKSSYECTHRLRHKNGEWMWVAARAVVADRDDNARPLRIVGTHTDITERKRLEELQRQTGERLELALSGGDIGLWDRDLRTGRTIYNDQWWSLFGFGADERQGYEGLWKQLVHPDDYDASRQELMRHTAGETPMYVGEVRARHKSGEYLWVQNRAKVVERDAAAAPLRIVGITMNITESKRVEYALLEERRRLKLITDSMPALIMHIDQQERYTFVNAHFDRVFGINGQKLLGKTLRSINGEAVYQEIAPYVAMALRGQTTSFEAIGPARGESRNYQSTYVPDIPATGDVSGFFALTHDITDRKRAEEELLEKQRALDALARVDTLTGLVNRREIESHAAQAIARTQRSKMPLALLYIDVDHFKRINDCHGHAGGDGVLKAIANRLQACIRATDCAARYAGDEFMLCLEGVSSAEVDTVTNKIIDAMRLPIPLVDGDATTASLSMGVAIHEGGPEDFDALSRRADGALYEAKAQGRNQAVLAR